MSDTMNETKPLSSARKAWVESVSMLLDHKTLIISCSLVAAAATAVYIFFFASVWYKSEANVLPALRSMGMLDNLAAGISSTIKDLGLTQLAGRNKSDNIYSPLALVSSRSVREQVIKEFDLTKVYDLNEEDAIKEFGEHASVDVLEEGNIGISFEDTDPKRAAAITNRLVAKLNEINSKLAMDEARFNKIYIEKRYNKLLADLDSADHALGEYQKKYGVYELKTQAQAQLTVLGTLEQQRYISEVQLANAEQLYGTQSPEANALRTQLNEMRSKLADLKSGMDKDAKSYFVPTDLMPEVALQYLQLTREVEIQSKLKAFLLPSYEQVKMDENKQLLAYLTLDSARVPMKKSRPKRSIVILIALVSGFALSSLGVIGIVRFREARSRFKADRHSLGV